jgi:hypothetical protein
MPCYVNGRIVGGDRVLCASTPMANWVDDQSLLAPTTQTQPTQQSAPSVWDNVSGAVGDAGEWVGDQAQDYWDNNSAGDMALHAAMMIPAVRGVGLAYKGLKGMNIFKSGIPKVANVLKSTATKVKPIKHATTGKPIPRMVNQQAKHPNGKLKWKTDPKTNKVITNRRGKKLKVMERVPMTDKAGNIMYQTKRQFDAVNALTTGGLLAGGIVGGDGQDVPQRPEGTQGPLSQDGGFYGSDKTYKEGEKMADKSNLFEYTGDDVKRAASEGDIPTNMWDKMKTKEYWMDGIEGGSGKWDNRLFRLGEMMNYMGMPSDKRGDSPSKRWSSANTEAQKVSAAATKASTVAGGKATTAQRTLWKDMVKAQSQNLRKKYMLNRGGFLGWNKMSVEDQEAIAVEQAQSEMNTKYQMIGMGIEPTDANYIMFKELMAKGEI